MCENDFIKFTNSETVASASSAKRSVSVTSYLRIFFVFALSVYCSLFPPQVYAETVVNSSSQRQAILGSAYSSDKQSFIGGECLQGSPEPTGSPDASFALDQTITEHQLETSLGFDLGARARYGLWEGSASANFFTRSVSTAFSLSVNYSASYNFSVIKMVQPTKTATGLNVSAQDDRWDTTCGDKVVNEVYKGARLFASVRIDFVSSEQKSKFEGKFKITGPMAGIDAKLEEASAQFAKDIRITVSAYQLGGDVSKLTAVFGNSDTARDNYVQCSLGHLEKCAAVLTGLLQYVGDTTAGFPSQLAPGVKPGPADLSYGVVDYSAYGIYPKSPQLARDVIAKARQELQRTFETTSRQYATAQQISLRPLTTVRRNLLEHALTDLRSNITALYQTANTCYDKPTQCPTEVYTNLHLRKIDESIFLPPTFFSSCVEALGLGISAPIRLTVNAVIEVLDRGGSASLSTDDCKIYASSGEFVG
jgi:hypothetical protein